MKDLSKHLELRGSLYRSLGISPLTFRGARVLEVAVGSGQNSLYLAALKPRELVLIEPNPIAIRDIIALYYNPPLNVVQPRLVETTLQDFHESEPFDIVICENWLGHLPEERELLHKLGTLVAEDGVLVITLTPPVGMLANILRYVLSVRIAPHVLSFDDRTRFLLEAFSNHLDSVSSMTRCHVDWIHDNSMNPHYFGLCLPLQVILDELSDSFECYKSNPDFITDMRWFKSLHGLKRNFNGHFLGEYYANYHNFTHYQQEMFRRPVALNKTLDCLAWNVYKVAKDFDSAIRNGISNAARYKEDILILAKKIIDNLVDQPLKLSEPLHEFIDLFRRDNITPKDAADMRVFSHWFGRETVYISLIRPYPN